MVDISGLSKAAVLAALHNATRAIGVGRLHDLGRAMTESEAETIIARRTDDVGFNRSKDLYFDYVQGRPLKVDLSKDEFDPWLFDRDSHKGAAAEAVAKLRAKS